MAGYKGDLENRGAYDENLKIFLPRTENKSTYPRLLGNMCVGQIVETGNEVSGLSEGELVFSHGGFREEHVWHYQRVKKLPKDVPWQTATCLDPTEFAIGAVRDGNVRLGDAVAIFGMGAIGLMAVQISRLVGAYPVIAIDPIPLRQKVAQKCGADLVIDPNKGDVGKQIRIATDNRGADICIEYSGHYTALQAALRGVCYLGTVVAGAYPSPYPAGLDFGAEAHFNRPKIIFSRACSEPLPEFPNWNNKRIVDLAWRLLSQGTLNCKPIIQPIVQFSDLVKEYPKIETQPNENVKLGVRF